MKMYNRVFIDMDGVLADFEKGFRDCFGCDPQEYEKKHGQEEFWLLINTTPNFFLNLPRMKGFHETFKMAQAISKTPAIILTSPSYTNRELCVLQKRTWVDENLSPHQPVLFESKKYKYAKPGYLLIDDREDKIKSWVAAGGDGFLFTTSENFVSAIKAQKEMLERGAL